MGVVISKKKKDNDGLVNVYPVNFGQVTTFKPQGEGKRCSCPENSVEVGESSDAEEGWESQGWLKAASRFHTSSASA